jgi:GT2 family glycosyltransferase
MNGAPRVSAVIPVHNRAELLARLLATMRLQTVPFHEIVVVDNASTDGAAELARQSGCHVIPLATNAGFARAVNCGWRSASGEWIAILNSDVELDPRWLERLLESAADAGFATGKLLMATDHALIDGTYDLLSRSGCAWRAGHGDNNQTGDTPKAIAIAPGTACLFRRDVLARLNGFDEAYGSYLEDVDLGLRCLRAGIKGVYVPAALAFHHGSATLGRWDPRVVRLISRNQLRLVERNYDPALFRSCLWAILAGQLLWGIVALRHGAFRAWLGGKWDALRHFHIEGEPSVALRDFLSSSEREIEDRATDPYWRIYFRCCGTMPHE